MSLACFQCCRRNRKQAVEEPVPLADPQATTEPVNLPGITPQPRSTDIQSPELDDTAIVPANGFLNSYPGKGYTELPTYRPKNEMPQFFSPVNWVLLTITDVLLTMHKESYLARCVLFETARLQRPLFSVGPLKLSQDARLVDMQLIQLNKVLDKGDELIQGSWDEEDKAKQDLVLKGKPFQKALRTAKTSLLELEKTLNDEILGELKNGMQSKASIDYKQIDGKVENLNTEIQQVYKRVTTIYYEEYRRVIAPG